MNNAATLALALLGITVLDLVVVSQDSGVGPTPPGRSTLYGARLGQQFAQLQGNFDRERAARLSATWGEWRLGKLTPSSLRLYDANAETSRVFPAPAWLTPEPTPMPTTNQRRGPNQRR